MRKKYFNDFEKNLIIFIINMYLDYGESIDIFPNKEKKEILLHKIIELKNKIENDKTHRKVHKKNKP
jgi:hypothetical protein